MMLVCWSVSRKADNTTHRFVPSPNSPQSHTQEELCLPVLILEILTHGMTILIIYICAFSKQGDTSNTA